MRRIASWVLTLLLAGLAVPAYGQVKLEWKFRKGDKFYVQSENSTISKIMTGGQESKQEARYTIVTRFTVKEEPEKGDVVLEQKIESVKVQTGARGEKEAQKIAGEIKGATFTFTLNRNRKVTGFAGYEKQVEKISRISKQLGETFRLLFPEDSYKKSIEEIFGVLPDKPVAKDDSWSRSLTMSQGPIGDFKMDLKYTYRGKIKEGERIGFTARMTYTPPSKTYNKTSFKVINKVINGKLEVARFELARFEGTMIFDARRDRLVSSKLTSVIKGSMLWQIVDLEKPVKVNLEVTQTITSKVLDRNPADK